MCGIVGYIGCKNASQILINALKKLEYRGYDSAGIAIIEDDDIIVRKCKGALKYLEEKIANEVIKGTVGIGHTRWATHGEPSDTNSHPHASMDGSISIGHNGIIENYAELKAKLQAQGVVFKSQTDTEVVVHLIDKAYKQYKDIFKAVLEVLHVVGGFLGLVSSRYARSVSSVRFAVLYVIIFNKNLQKLSRYFSL